VEKIFKLFAFVQKFVSTLGKSLFMYFLKHSRRSKDIFFNWKMSFGKKNKMKVTSFGDCSSTSYFMSKTC